MRGTLDEALPFVEVRLPEPGARFGAYEIEAPVGEGGMAVVYRARHVGLGRPVALKVLKPDTVEGDPEAVPRFLREARVAAALSHPGIAIVHDVGAEGDTPYLAMEWIDGPTLRTLMHRKDAATSLSRARRLELLGAIAEILSYAHGAGVMHRDLKPSNVIVDREGKPKLLDFGLAKRFVAANTFETHDDVALGTPSYMAPEAETTSKVDGRVDQYAWGVIAYELLTGARPSRGGRDEEPAIEAVLARATARSPEERFASMDALLAAWQSATSPPAPPPSPERARRHVPVFVGSAGLALALGSLTLFAVLRDPAAAAPPSEEVAEPRASATTVSSAEPDPEPAPPASAGPLSIPDASTPPPKPGLPAGWMVARQLVRLGHNATTEGTEGPQRDLDAVLRRLDPMIARCVAGVPCPSLSRLGADFTIHADGSTSDVAVSTWTPYWGSAAEVEGALARVLPCVERTVRRARFEPLENARVSRLHVDYFPR